MYRVIFVLMLVFDTLAFLQKNLQSLDFKINPEYGNITKSLDNSTHTGPVELWLNQNITNFTVALIVHKDTGELFANFTIKPCVSKVKQKINSETEKTLGFSEKASQRFAALPGRVCPIAAGHYIIEAKESKSRLPFTVSSLNGTPGKFVKNATLVNIKNGNNENFLSVIEKYEILNLEE